MVAYLKCCKRCGGDCFLEEGRDGKYKFKELVCLQCSHSMDFNAYRVEQGAKQILDSLRGYEKLDAKG